MTTTDFLHEADGRVAAGEGMVLRTDRVALVSRPGGDPRIAGRLVALAQADHDPAQVHHALGELLAPLGPDERPNCVLVVDDGRGLLLSLVGRSQASGRVGGEPFELRSNDRQSWIDIRLPPSVDELTVGSSDISAPPAEDLEGSPLESGLALGVALQLRAGTETQTETQAEAAAEGEAEAPSPPPPTGAPHVVVTGILCENQHFNHPGARYCRIDGASLQDAADDPVERPRPSLGVFVLLDGTTVTLDQDLVVGRSPHGDPATEAGARPMVIDDPTIAPVHALVRLVGWDVVVTDRQDEYTTWIWPLGGQARAMHSGESVTLNGGDRVAFGNRELLFESHHR